MGEVNVRVGGLTFWGGAGADGFYIGDDSLRGVFGGVGVKGRDVEAPHRHGDFDVPVFRSGRVVSLAGPCHSPNAEVHGHRNRQLTGLLAGGDVGRVVFDIPGGPLWADGRLADAPEWRNILWGSWADYFLQLKFADPRLYGETRKFDPASSLSLHHYGNFAALPVFTITGTSGGGYTINGPGGRKFTVTTPLVGGVPHTVSMRDGYLRVGGSIVMGGVTRADLWAVPPGAKVTVSVTAGSLSASVADTFI